MRLATQQEKIELVIRKFYAHRQNGVGPEDSHELVARELKMPLTHVIDILRP